VEDPGALTTDLARPEFRAANIGFTGHGLTPRHKMPVRLPRSTPSTFPSHGVAQTVTPDNSSKQPVSVTPTRYPSYPRSNLRMAQTPTAARVAAQKADPEGRQEILKTTVGAAVK
jgi:hypothetical protein